eukprot:535792-Pelagomonas_calceolata.AAC.2
MYHTCLSCSPGSVLGLLLFFAHCCCNTGGQACVGHHAHAMLIVRRLCAVVEGHDTSRLSARGSCEQEPQGIRNGACWSPTSDADAHFPWARGCNSDCGDIQGLVGSPGHCSLALDGLAGGLKCPGEDMPV